MKTKTLKEINAQASNILCAIVKTDLNESDKVARMRKVNAISRRYGRNALNYLKKQLSPVELDEYGVITSVPASISAK